VEETDYVTWVHLDDLPALVDRSTPTNTIDALKVISRNGKTEQFNTKLSFKKLQPRTHEEDLACPGNEGLSLGTTFIFKRVIMNEK